jgi:hypothetical protein
MFKERFSNINTAKAQIEKQREFDAIRARLTKEFEILDQNKDGLVTLDELQNFLDKKVSNLAMIMVVFIVKRWKI